MKKKYSLDYGIERDIDRLHAVEDILDTLPENPTNTELEQMASYILYGKDENGQNAVQRLCNAKKLLILINGIALLNAWMIKLHRLMNY